MALKPEQLRGQRHDVGLADRLPAADGHGPVGIRLVLRLLGHEQVARHRQKRLKHASIGDAPRLELLLDHLPTLRIEHAAPTGPPPTSRTPFPRRLRRAAAEPAEPADGRG